jgi:uncharacterized membrane protein
MQLTQFALVDQAITNIMIGVGLALLNVLFCYFVRGAPRLIKIVPRQKQLRTLLFAYLIALILQLVTSPFFRAYTVPVALELAWSPYQAIFNVLGVVLVDVIVIAVTGVRRGAEAASRGIGELGERATSALDSVGDKFSSGEAERPAEADGGQNTEGRRARLDDKLKDY